MMYIRLGNEAAVFQINSKQKIYKSFRKKQNKKVTYLYKHNFKNQGYVCLIFQTNDMPSCSMKYPWASSTT